MGTTFRKRQDGKPQSVLAIRATAVDEVYHGGPQYRGQLLEPICHYSLMWVTEPSDSSQNQVRFGRKNPQLLRGHPDQQKQKLSCFQLFWGALRVPPTPKPANLDCIKHSRVLFCFFKIYLFWLWWVFVAVSGLSPVAVSRGYSSLWCVGFSLRWFLLLRALALDAQVSAVVANGLSCSKAYGIFPD